MPGSVETPRQAKWYTPEGEDEIVAAQCLNERIQPADVAAMALFLAAMLLLVLANNYLVLYLGWEGVGLASYLLIGFWYHKPSAATAARRTPPRPSRPAGPRSSTRAGERNRGHAAALNFTGELLRSSRRPAGPRRHP